MASKPKKGKGKSGGIAPKPKQKHGFQKGVAANPTGKNGYSNPMLFGTRDPFKQALIRVLKERDEALDPAKRARSLDGLATKLIDSALDLQNPLGYINSIADRLDGKPQSNDPPASINTFQLVLNTVRNLNLTVDQLDELDRQIIEHTPSAG